MAYRELRAYMDALEKEGELVRAEEEVDWKLELGAILRRIYEHGAPSTHFKNIKGHPKNYTIFGAPMGRGKGGIWKKLLIALEMATDTPYPKLLEDFMKRKNTPIKPIQVKTGPCKENILKGDQVNLFSFPAPYLQEGDGGRYLGTWGSTITKDLEGGWVNWGMYRQMIHRRNRLGGLFLPTSHMGIMFYGKYVPRNRPMPFAIALGTEPAISIASAIPAPQGVNEAEVAGGLRREALHLVKCETNDLFVPASSEIVIEGVIMPKERWDEGPFGDYAGYRAVPRMPRPVYRVECITHRNDPILPVASSGTPIDEWDIINGLSFDAEMMENFRKRGWPVTGCFTPPWLSGNYVIVTTKIPYAHFAHQITSAIRNTAAGRFVPYVQVCDDDIDPTNFDMVIHALATKCHPRRGTQVIDETHGNPFMPFVNADERRISKSSAVTLDCTWPTDWDPAIAVPPRASFDQIYPKEVQAKVLKNWTKVYGFPEKKAEIL